MDEQRENEHQAEAKTTGQSPVVSQFTDEVRERMSLLRPQAPRGGSERRRGRAPRRGQIAR